MILRGFFKHDAPFFNARLFSEKHHLDNDLDFLLDTGASRTCLLDKDLHFLGINKSKLRRSEKKFGGVGGLVDTYRIEDAKLFFQVGHAVMEIALPIFVIAHDLGRKTLEEKNKILQMPSILGRDIINRFRLVYSLKENSVYLES